MPLNTAISAHLAEIADIVPGERIELSAQGL